MNRSNMIQQATLSRKTMVTKFTFERLFLLMNRKSQHKPTTLQIKMHKLNKHIFQSEKFFVNSKNRTLPSSSQP